MGGGGKGGGTQTVYDYRMSLHYGVCVGPVDEFIDIEVNEKWLGLQSSAENTVYAVDDMNLFGGPKKGGGVRGSIFTLFGAADQVLPEFLAAKLGRSSNTVTAYRNIFSVWFTAPQSVFSTALSGAFGLLGSLITSGFSVGTEGFTWSTNMPSIPPVRVKVKRAPVSISGDDSMIGPNANPAHIIYETLTNSDWGAGYDPAQFKENTFLEAAQTLRDEDFGLSFIWTGQSALEDFVNEVLQHISANLTFDLKTGRWELKLLRGDYEIETLPEINPKNAELVAFQRKSWGETINEIVLTWSNPENEEEETVTQQDASGMSIQRLAVSDSSKNYLGIRSQSLAWRVAERDLRQEGTPLATVEVEVSRDFQRDYDVKPGTVLWFNWGELDEDGDVFSAPFAARVSAVKNPSRGDAGLVLTLVEDIFSYGVSQTGEQGSEFVSPDQLPIDPPNVYIQDAPYFAIVQRAGDSFAQELTYPENYTVVLVDTGLTDIRDIHLNRIITLPEQDPAYAELALLDDLAVFELEDVLDQEITSVINFPGGYYPEGLTVGGLIFMGSGASEEIAVVTSLSATSVGVRRGVLDTTPKAHPIGTKVWGLNRTSSISDDREAAVGDVLSYKLLPSTSLGKFPLADATEHTHTVGERAYLPYRPANVQVNGTQVFEASISAADTSIALAWSNRNRFTETTNVLTWDAANATPEVNQETEAELVHNGSVIATMPATTGTTGTLTIPGATITAGDTLTVRVWASRDGFESWQTVEIPVSVT